MTAIPHVRAASLTRWDFEERYAKRNLPVVLTHAAEGWGAAEQWVSSSGTVDVECLAQSYGHHKVTVHSHGSKKAREMSVGEYFELWKARSSEKNGGEEAWSYLKDWH